MRGISIKAVFFGGVTDIVVSTVLGIPLGIYVVATHGLNNLHKDALREAVVAAVHSSPLLYAAQLLIGFGASIFGGFVAASLALDNKRLNGILASWLCVGIGIRALVTGQDGMSTVVVAFIIAVTPICYFIGASLRAKRDASRSSRA
jgi:TRAP-type C4-dicarboxylate transport system permease large subunit